MPVLSLVFRLVRGAVAGLAATVPMTAVMATAQAVGLVHRQPPREITDSALARLRPLRRRPPDELSAPASWLSHFAFGASAGAVYGAAFAGRRRPRPMAGPVYALSVWFLSYQGWLPAARLMPPASRDSHARQATLVLAHLVYGSALDVLIARRRH